MTSPAISNSKLVIGEAIFAPHERKIEVAGREQRLEPRLADLLEVFCEHPEEVLDRDTLLDRVWGDEGSDEALTQAVSRLRQLLGAREIIQTEPRKGYRLTLHPRVAKAGAHIEPIAESKPEFLRSGPYSARTVQLAFASGIMLGLLVASLVAVVLWPETVTVIEEVTQPIEGDPETRTIRCEGTGEECLEAEADRSLR